jgi:hypothetical protein
VLRGEKPGINCISISVKARGVPLMNLAGIVLIPFATLCRAVLFEKWQQKKRLCFSVTKNTAAQKLPSRARYFIF